MEDFTSGTNLEFSELKLLRSGTMPISSFDGSFTELMSDRRIAVIRSTIIIEMT